MEAPRSGAFLLFSAKWKGYAAIFRNSFRLVRYLASATSTARGALLPVYAEQTRHQPGVCRSPGRGYGIFIGAQPVARTRRGTGDAAPLLLCAGVEPEYRPWRQLGTPDHRCQFQLLGGDFVLLPPARAQGIPAHRPANFPAHAPHRLFQTERDAAHQPGPGGAFQYTKQTGTQLRGRALLRC